MNDSAKSKGRKFDAVILRAQALEDCRRITGERLNALDKSFENAAKKANRFQAVTEDMKAWQAFE
jgi:hypothetical protein